MPVAPVISRLFPTKVLPISPHNAREPLASTRAGLRTSLHHPSCSLLSSHKSLGIQTLGSTTKVASTPRNVLSRHPLMSRTPRNFFASSVHSSAISHQLYYIPTIGIRSLTPETTSTSLRPHLPPSSITPTLSLVAPSLDQTHFPLRLHPPYPLAFLSSAVSHHQ